MKWMDQIWFGGDYSPEQWSEDEIIKDIKQLKNAGVNIITLGVFAWTVYQKEEEVFDFSPLVKIIGLLENNKIDVCLSTGTAAQPAWLSSRYPKMLPVDKDGRTFSYGSRQSYCPNSIEYRTAIEKYVCQLAFAVQSSPSLKIWHINNEYAAHNPACYCTNCEFSFRNWLKAKYGRIENLNKAWNSMFWGQLYSDFGEVIPPRRSTYTNNPSQELDYRRFMSDSTLDCYLIEKRILKVITPEIPVTTNFMGWFKPLDYFKWAEHIDVISFDSYPESVPSYDPAISAFNYDMMRCLKIEFNPLKNQYAGKPFLLMEQAPSHTNWRDVNPSKRPGHMRLQSWQALSRGSNSVMFFQCKQSRGGSEMYHSSIIPANGNCSGRVYQEIQSLGKELSGFESILETTVYSDVAIMFDWENWWAVENSNKPSSRISYYENVMCWYRAVFGLNLSCDIIPFKSDLSHMQSYKLIIAPLMHMIHPGMEQGIRDYVDQGGHFATTFFSGMIAEDGNFKDGGYMSSLKEIFGIEIDEFDTFPVCAKNRIRSTLDYYDCEIWADVIRLISADVLYCFESDYYADKPAVTSNVYGNGKAYYVATFAEQDFYRHFIQKICSELQIQVPLEHENRTGNEICTRENEHSSVVIEMNNLEAEVKVTIQDSKQQAGQDTQNR